MMKKYVFLTALLLSVSVFATSAQADPKFMGFEWYSDHWTNQDFIPYYEDGTDPQNTQWDTSTWTPSTWINRSGKTGAEFIHHLQVVGILKDNGRANGATYINVGPNFYHLSGQDKRRVISTLDAVYQVTTQQPGMFYLRDPRTEKMIGTYTKDGLFLE